MQQPAILPQQLRARQKQQLQVESLFRAGKLKQHFVAKVAKKKIIKKAVTNSQLRKNNNLTTVNQYQQFINGITGQQFTNAVIAQNYNEILNTHKLQDLTPEQKTALLNLKISRVQDQNTIDENAVSRKKNQIDKFNSNILAGNIADLSKITKDFKFYNGVLHTLLRKAAMYFTQMTGKLLLVKNIDLHGVDISQIFVQHGDNDYKTLSKLYVNQYFTQLQSHPAIKILIDFNKLARASGGFRKFDIYTPTANTVFNKLIGNTIKKKLRLQYGGEPSQKFQASLLGPKVMASRNVWKQILGIQEGQIQQIKPFTQLEEEEATQQIVPTIT